MKNWLKIMVAVSAFLIAGCAAFFSVTGLGVLFSGASIAVMIMAGSLEFAKLITATYLKQSWNKIRGFNKWYLTTAVGILMIITSAGIFGYLSNAFQQQNIKLEQVQREISVWDNKIKSNEKQVIMLTAQLTNLESNQGKIIDNGNGKLSNRLIKSVDNRDKEASKIRNKITSLQDSSIVYNSKINDIKNDNIAIEREVGGFRFVADAFGIELNNVVKFFIILIVIVFDPLAIALIIAFNQLVMGENKPKDKKKDEENEEIDVDELKDIISESNRMKPTESELKNIESILSKKPYITKEQALKNNVNDGVNDGVNEGVNDGVNVTGKMKPDGVTKLRKRTYEDIEEENILEQKTKNKMKQKEFYPALSDEEVHDMFMDEWERKFDMVEEEPYIPTDEEEKQNFSTMDLPEQPNDTSFSTNESEIENYFQQEDYNGQFEDWKNEEVPEPFATTEEVEEHGIDTPIEETPKVETIEEPLPITEDIIVETPIEVPIQETPDEKKK